MHVSGAEWMPDEPCQAGGQRRPGAHGASNALLDVPGLALTGDNQGAMTRGDADKGGPPASAASAPNDPGWESDGRVHPRPGKPRGLLWG